MEEVNLYIDESGDLGTGGRYFLICALEVQANLKKSLIKRAGRVIERYKKERHIKKTNEIKGCRLKDAGRLELINKILYKGISVRYIVLDLKKTTMLLDKADDKNACYNYLIQLIVKKIVEENKYTNKINLYMDNRSVKIGNRLSLKPYLYNKLVLEQLENDSDLRRIDFDINYFESESCYLIQWADIIANSLFKKYNSSNNSYYEMIKPHIIFESRFPAKSFGK